MNEIELYYDKEGKDKIVGKIIFPVIDSGKVTVKELWVKNNILFPISLNIKVKGNDVKLSKSITQIAPKSIEKIELKFTPKLFTKEPIKMDIEIDYEYIARK